ncbi:MAG: hypothetical protein Q9162_003555 [Coniocarpon cinnabarinum]
MRLSLPHILFGLSFLNNVSATRDYDTHDYYAVHLDAGVSPQDVAGHLGLEYDRQLAGLDHHHLFRHPKHDNDIIKTELRAHKRRKRSLGLSYRNDLLDSIRLNQKQILKPPKQKRSALPIAVSSNQAAQQNSGESAKESAVQQQKEVARQLSINDPMFAEQWHLFNPVQLGHDINVTGVWSSGVTGKNATVCIVDDGLDLDSPDLAANYFAAGSYDFNDDSKEPKPRLSDDQHGTRCAGEVAAVRNDVCGVGVAYDAKVAGIRILSKPITDSDEAEAMVYGFQENDIYSCSWGPPDDGKEMGEPGILIKRAMISATQQGRGGLGTIYVFAAGNGAQKDDNCNFDGYTNSIYSITVGAIDRKGIHPYYSEKCSAQMAVTYSSGSGDAIHTTNVANVGGGCTKTHGGTSAAGPLAAAMFALVLEVRPDLGWRDMQWLTMETAVPFETPGEPTPYDWQNTSLGKQFSHQYGYGKLDAWALVEKAKDWQKVKPQAWYKSPWQHVRAPIPQGDQGLAHHYTVTKDLLRDANLERVEQVTVTMNVNHTRRGDLAVELQSPSGMTSHLSTARRLDEFNGGYVDWTFMSVAHWGESGVGDWKIVVKDLKENDHTGTFVDWRLSLFGECIDAKKQRPLPLPEENDDDDHDREDAVASTHPVDVPTATGEPLEHPTDHPERPTVARPSGTPADATTEPTTTMGFSPPRPVETGAGTDKEEDLEYPSSTSGSSSTSTADPDKFLPGPFPTFGVSKRTQVWIYGAFALIVIFCISIGTYLYMAKRKQQKNSRENYEFQSLNDDDFDDDIGGARTGRGGKRRARELYDAFAGESDENLFSDDEEYRDEPHGEQDESDEKQLLSSSSDSSRNEQSRPR